MYSVYGINLANSSTSTHAVVGNLAARDIGLHGHPPSCAEDKKTMPLIYMHHSHSCLSGIAEGTDHFLATLWPCFYESRSSETDFIYILQKDAKFANYCVMYKCMYNCHQ